jgi:hypothetical protein
MSRFVRRLLAATLGVFILAVPALAAPVRSLPRDGFGFPGSGDSQQQILQILRQGKARSPRPLRRGQHRQRPVRRSCSIRTW